MAKNSIIADHTRGFCATDGLTYPSPETAALLIVDHRFLPAESARRALPGPSHFLLNHAKAQPGNKFRGYRPSE